MFSRTILDDPNFRDFPALAQGTRGVTLDRRGDWTSAGFVENYQRERINLMTLTLADANRVIAGAIEKANQLNTKMNIAVCDAGGRLLAFQRMDGAMWAGSFGSQGKAMASAAFGRPSGELTPRADHPTLRGIAEAEGKHMFYGQGAMPIFRQGVLIGACGVGGGTAQEDEDCARAGVERL